jgi:O-antigen ligase
MADAARPARRAEWIFACVVLFWLSRGLGPLHEPLTVRPVIVSLLAISLWLLWRERQALKPLLAVSWLLLMPALVAALSPAWSIDPQESLRAAVAIEAYTAFGLWLALRFDLSNQHRMVSGVLALVVAGSALVSVAAPSIGLMEEPHAGAWQGLYFHKNAFGRVLALAVLACGLLAIAEPRARAWAGSATALALALFKPVRSVGGAAALALAAGPITLTAWLRRLSPTARASAAITIAGLLTVAGALALVAAPKLLALVGRDVTLTRRTDIWSLVLPAIGERPWLGFGIGAFWHVAPESEKIVKILHFSPGSAHNGFFDLALELGIVGFTAFCLPFGLAFARSVRMALTERGAGALWPLAFLSWLVTSNLVEGALLRRGPLGWTIFVATAALLAVRHAAMLRRLAG